MTFWDYLDRSRLTERAWVTILLAVLIGSLLKMADHNPGLWQIELFKTLLTASVITGALNMVLAFHFTANKSDETKTQNTSDAFKTMRTIAENSGVSSDSSSLNDAKQEGADLVKDAAAETAEHIGDAGKGM